MIKQLLSLLILFLSITNLAAQEIKKNEKVKFGEIDINEFSTELAGTDSSATAIILFDVGHISFTVNKKGQWVFLFQRHKRLKILSQKGLNYNNIEIPIYKSLHEEETLDKVKIASYNLVKGKIVENILLKEEKFEDQFHKNYTNYKYTLSKVQVGTIIDINYQIESDIFDKVPDWYFQSELPVIYSELHLSLPEFFNYNVELQSLHPIQLVSDYYVPTNIERKLIGEGIQNDLIYKTNYKTRTRVWVGENIPAFKNEPFITISDDYITKLSFKIGELKIPDGTYKNYSSTWESIIAHYEKEDTFGKFIRKKSKKTASDIIINSQSNLEKANKIFDYVKNNIKWNGENGVLTTKTSIEDILLTKSGNIADINLTLLNLLLTANLEAKPILISTRNNGRYTEQPSYSKFNYVIVKLDLDTSSFLLDASSINNTFDIISFNSLNHKGFVIDLKQKKGEWISLETKKHSKISTINTIEFDTDLKIKGTSVINRTIYKDLEFRNHYQSFSNEASYVKDYLSNNERLKIIKYTTAFKNAESLSSEIIEYNLENSMKTDGDIIQFNPFVGINLMENPFKRESRNFAIDFAYPFSEIYRLVITIPEGYEAYQLPEAIDFKLQDNSASFLYNCIISDHQILIYSDISINKSVIPSSNYLGLKELFNQKILKQNQLVVLKKTN